MVLGSQSGTVAQTSFAYKCSMPAFGTGLGSVAATAARTNMIQSRIALPYVWIEELE